MASKAYTALDETSASKDERRAFQAKATELCLIESRFDIMTPPRDIKPLLGDTQASGSPLVNWVEPID